MVVPPDAKFVNDMSGAIFSYEVVCMSTSHICVAKQYDKQAQGEINKASYLHVQLYSGHLVRTSVVARRLK